MLGVLGRRQRGGEGGRWKGRERRGVITKHILNEMKNLSALCVDQ